MDLVDHVIGLLLRHLDAVAQADHAQHAAAGSRQALAGQGGAGMESHAVDGFRRNPGNQIVLARCIRITGSGHYHAQCGAAVPFQFDGVERAVDGMFHHHQQVGFQARHDRLGFRIAHAAIEFQRLWIAVVVNHQACIQEAAERDAVLGHTLHGRRNDLAHHAGVQRRSNDRCRRIRAHAAGVRALVVVLEALVVLAGGQRQDVLAIYHDDEAGFLAGQEFLDHHARAGIAEAIVGQHHVDCGVRFFQVHGHNHALAGSQAVGLDDDRCAFLVDVLVRRTDIGEGLVLGGWNVMTLHERLGEILGAFQLRCFTRRSEDFQAAVAENVDDTSRQRHFGADHGQRDMLTLDKIRQRGRIGNVDVFQPLIQRRTAVAGSNEDGLNAR